jgi:hypothetical protein
LKELLLLDFRQRFWPLDGRTGRDVNQRNFGIR